MQKFLFVETASSNIKNNPKSHDTVLALLKQPKYLPQSSEAEHDFITHDGKHRPYVS